jgi:hypothetical protein
MGPRTLQYKNGLRAESDPGPARHALGPLASYLPVLMARVARGNCCRGESYRAAF